MMSEPLEALQAEAESTGSKEGCAFTVNGW
jgi:hypothetical protein